MSYGIFLLPVATHFDCDVVASSWSSSIQQFSSALAGEGTQRPSQTGILRVKNRYGRHLRSVRQRTESSRIGTSRTVNRPADELGCFFLQFLNMFGDVVRFTRGPPDRI